jgi:nitronate monooxygenase
MSSRWPKSDLAALLGIQHPIILSPMSLSGTPALAAAVTNAGGMGSLGFAELSEGEMRAQFEATRALTKGPFNINFFVHQPPVVPTDGAAVMRERLSPYYRELGLGEVPELSCPVEPLGGETLELVLELEPDVVSFHFGLPRPDMVDALKSAGTVILSSATTVSEARTLESAGADAIVAQGSEAGGHRGSFEEPLAAGTVGTLALVPQVADAVSVPVIAAGGIADGRGIAAAFALGASGVQMGTAFLPCPESGASPLYRKVLAGLRDDGTRLSRLYTGRLARFVVDRLVDEMAPYEDAAAPYPLQESLTSALYTDSTKRESADFGALLSGQAAPLNRVLPAAELVDTLVAEAQAVLREK